MIHHYRHQLATLCWLLVCSRAVAETLDCSKPIKLSGKTFDLSQLKSDNAWNVESTLDTPPTTRKTFIQANLCDRLAHNDSLSDSDQCPSGTRVCMTISNLKDGQDERITAVQPLAGEFGKGDLNPEFSLGTPLTSDKPAPLEVKMHGGMYGDREQSTVVVLACEPDQLDIKLISHSYSFSTATLSMAFSSAKFCASTEGEGDNKDRKEPEAPSKPDQGTGQSEGGWGFFSWLFFLIFSGLALYFAVGMWIRHSQYDARGWDMLPHRDFWADLPYVVRDLVSSRRNNGGYAAI